MPNKNYLAGRRTEYVYGDKLKAEGYDIVQRTAGSHSPVDVLAIRYGEVLLVQLKRGNVKLETARKKFRKEIEAFIEEIPAVISVYKRFVYYSTRNGERGFHTLYED